MKKQKYEAPMLDVTEMDCKIDILAGSTGNQTPVSGSQVGDGGITNGSVVENPPSGSYVIN